MSPWEQHRQGRMMRQNRWPVPSWRRIIVAFVAAWLGLGGTAIGKPWAHPTRAQFIVEADRICKAGIAKEEIYADEIKKIGNPRTADQVAAIVTALRKEEAISHADLASLQSLPEPASDRTLLSKYWAAGAKSDKAAERAINALDTIDDGAATTDEQSNKVAQAREEGLAEGYGFKSCR